MRQHLGQSPIGRECKKDRILSEKRMSFTQCPMQISYPANLSEYRQPIISEPPLLILPKLHMLEIWQVPLYIFGQQKTILKRNSSSSQARIHDSIVIQRLIQNADGMNMTANIHRKNLIFAEHQSFDKAYVIVTNNRCSDEFCYSPSKNIPYRTIFQIKQHLLNTIACTGECGIRATSGNLAIGENFLQREKNNISLILVIGQCLKIIRLHPIIRINE